LRQAYDYWQDQPGNFSKVFPIQHIVLTHLFQPHGQGEMYQ